MAPKVIKIKGISGMIDPTINQKLLTGGKVLTTVRPCSACVAKSASRLLALRLRIAVMTKWV